MTRSQVRVFSYAMLIVTCAWGGTFLLDVFGVGMAPFKAQVPIAADGIKMREEFRVWRHCTFEVGMRLMHDEFGQFDGLLVEKQTLPWTFDVNVYRLDDGSQRILHVNQQPVRFAQGSNTTSFNFDFEDLPRGRYRIDVAAAQPPAPLVGHNLEVFVQVRPKSTCGQ